MLKLICINFIILIVLCNTVIINGARDLEWWEHATIYQIYPRSFMDSNGDGIGDLPGITSRMDHLKEIGIDAIWMSPMFQSALIDFGYDVIDFYKIHDQYGTLEDFDDFMAKAQELNIRVLLDFVPNHSSDLCEWFNNSVHSVPGFEDFYTWHDGVIVGGIRQPPNNWVSVFGGPAWTFNTIRNQWYLHQFFAGQPDLNYRNPAVVEEMEKVIKFWLNRGVAGFRVDAFNHLFEDPQFRNEPEWNQNADYESLDHIYTKDLDECYDVIYRWRKMVDDWAAENSTESKMLMTEAYADTNRTMRYYRSPETGVLGSNMPYNFELIYLDRPDDFSGQRIKGGIDSWLDNMPAGFSAPWATGSHDHRRIASRLGPGYVGIMHTIGLMLPGTSITYYGDEIGMLDNLDFTISDNRDPNRTPMQWNSSVGAGFSSTMDTWLPIHSNYQTLNVAAQQTADRSDYHHFIELTTLKKTQTIISGDVNIKSISSDVFAFIRELPDNPTYAIVTNSGLNQTVDLTIFVNLPDELIIGASSKNSNYRIGDTVPTNAIVVQQFDSLVLVSSSIKIILSTFTLIISFLIFIVY